MTRAFPTESHDKRQVGALVVNLNELQFYTDLLQS